MTGQTLPPSPRKRTRARSRNTADAALVAADGHHNIHDPQTVDAVVLLAVLPEYRKSFVEELTALSTNRGVRLRFVAGDAHSDATVRSAVHPGVRYVSNVHLLGRRILWQPRTVSAGIAADVTVVDLNPRSLTAWLVLCTRRTTRRRTLVWGHVNPRAGRNSKTAPLRRMMRRLASGVITYTWTDADQVRREESKSPVWVAANGLYPRELMEFNVESHRNRILYVGRLEPAKKPELLVEAFMLAIPNLPADTVLTIVGSGTLSNMLKRRIEEYGIQNQVELLGHIDGFSKLKKLYAETTVSVSPGYAGLSLTQTLGFGVPMIVADHEPHAPEIELLTPETGTYFAAGEAKALAQRLVEVFEGDLTWDPEHVIKPARARYSSSAMASGFLDAILGERQKGLDL